MESIHIKFLPAVSTIGSAMAHRSKSMPSLTVCILFFVAGTRPEGITYSHIHAILGNNGNKCVTRELEKMLPRFSTLRDMRFCIYADIPGHIFLRIELVVAVVAIHLLLSAKHLRSA